MKLENLKEGMPVIYLPLHKDRSEPIADNQLGIVSSTNHRFAFVIYLGSNGSQATNPDDLYSLDNRPDLIHRLGLEVKPINRICELWLEEQELLNPKNERHDPTTKRDNG